MSQPNPTSSQGVRQTNQSFFFKSDIFSASRLLPWERPGGVVHEAARAIPVFRDCGVLVVGGGPSGTAAAVAAARAGADVVLLERYNHLGGLSTGGLVIWIDRMTDWNGKQVIRGFAKELFDRLPADAIAGPARELGLADTANAAYWSERTAATTASSPGRRRSIPSGSSSPARKSCWNARSSSSPRRGPRADRGGWRRQGRGVREQGRADGDPGARHGRFHRRRRHLRPRRRGCGHDIEERDIHHCMNTSWIFGGGDMTRWIAFKAGDAAGFTAFMDRGRAQCGGLFERPFVSWRNDVALFMGPRLSGYSAIDVQDLTEVEVRSHRLMAQHLESTARMRRGSSRRS